MAEPTEKEAFIKRWSTILLAWGVYMAIKAKDRAAWIWDKFKSKE